MSSRADSPSVVSLEQQRKRAKDLLRAHREGRAEAALRILRVFPRARRQSVFDVLATAVANGVEDPRQRMPANAPAIADLLLARGADANAACNLYGGGAVPLGLLMTSGIPLRLALDGEMVRVLVRGGAKAGPRDLAHCIGHGMPRAAQALVDAGVPVDGMFAAAGLGRVDAIEDLLDRGVDVNARYAGAATALHAAAGMGHREAVVVLLRRGADVTLRNVWGGTPAGTARYFDHVDLAELIEQYRPGD